MGFILLYIIIIIIPKHTQFKRGICKSLFLLDVGKLVGQVLVFRMECYKCTYLSLLVSFKEKHTLDKSAVLT